ELALLDRDHYLSRSEYQSPEDSVPSFAARRIYNVGPWTADEQVFTTVGNVLMAALARFSVPGRTEFVEVRSKIISLITVEQAIRRNEMWPSYRRPFLGFRSSR